MTTDSTVWKDITLDGLADCYCLIRDDFYRQTNNKNEVIYTTETFDYFRVISYFSTQCGPDGDNGIFSMFWKLKVHYFLSLESPLKSSTIILMTLFHNGFNVKNMYLKNI
jgi:hypothetical protein